MFQENRAGGKFTDRSFTLLVGLFSLGLIVLGLLANPVVPIGPVHGKGSMPFFTGFTLLGVLGCLIHAALRAQQQKIRALESELAQIRLLRAN